MGFLQRGGKRYLSRQMEVNAAFLEHVDHHVGRVIDHIEEMGELDNTLVIYLTADNGCTAEGTPTGTFSELLMQNGFPAADHGTAAGKTRRVRRAGCLGRAAYGQPLFSGMGLRLIHPFPVDQADGVPFRRNHVRYGHTIPQSHQSKRRMATAVSECDRYRSNHSGSDRRARTRLCERPEAKEYPGKSLTYAWNDPDAKTNHPTQYFEMLGFMGLYHEGWTIAGNRIVFPGRRSLGHGKLRSPEYRMGAVQH
jgi:hypothetical protein